MGDVQKLGAGLEAVARENTKRIPPKEIVQVDKDGVAPSDSNSPAVQANKSAQRPKRPVTRKMQFYSGEQPVVVTNCRRYPPCLAREGGQLR